MDVWVRKFDGGETYQRLGSSGGLVALRDGKLDVAITDWPLTPIELSQGGLIQVPMCADAVVVAMNLASVTKLRLTGDVVSDIYRGTVPAWNHASIQGLNADEKLPAQRIRYVGRSDGSGTTRVFGTYLSRANRTWSRQFGAGFTVSWIDSVAQARGTSGVIEAMKAQTGSIGYMGLAEARRAGFTVVQLANLSGNYVSASAASISAALVGAKWDERNGDADIDRNTAPAAWPLTAVVYAVLRAQSSNAASAKRFMGAVIASGAADVSANGFVELPPAPKAMAARLLASLAVLPSAA